jgi:hypothetical protein
MTGMNRAFWLTAFLGVALGGAAACGSDGDEVVTPIPSGGSGGAAGGGTGGPAATLPGGTSSTGLPDKCTTDSECKGFLCCNGECIDVKSDVLHCGKCGTKCPGAETQEALCQGGTCKGCDAGKADCNAIPIDGCETTLATDAKNCGSCGKVCLLANAQGNLCEAGKCKIESCKAGFLDCDKEAENGCEIASATDPDNCGACGAACPKVANAKATCQLGKCEGFTCEPGFADCDKDPKNGCEVELGKDLNNCGTCGNVCDPVKNGVAACKDGICSIGSCNVGFDNCDGSTGNGCETDLAVDVNHCGACGQKCSAQTNSDAKCIDGFCGTGTCNPGYADCDPNVLGCEVNLSTDVNNCGVCGNPCPPVLNGTPKCELFACGIGSCNPGKKHCTGGEENGCETDIFSDLNNCGDCNVVCPPVANGTVKCTEGKCAVGTCKENFYDCDQLLETGCETDVTKSKQHCGFCDNPCPDPPNAVGKCDGGSCGIASCAPGFDNCDGKDANGCERPTGADPENCGGCGVICGSGICDGGQCICIPKILLLVDDSPAGAAPLIAAMQARGLQVDVAKEGGVDIPSWNYKGVPSPSGYGAVVILSGGPTVNPSQNAAITDMPVEGQQAIASFINASNGVVLTEWASQHVASGRWKILKDFVLLDRTVSFGGLVTYTVEPAFSNHPIWEGLPPSFKFSSTSNVGLVKLGNGNKRIASSPEALDPVAIRDEPKQGRVAQIAHAGSYNDNGWANPNITALVANAANWAARCK